MNMNTPVNTGGEWFPFMEQMGIDRRHAVLDISTENNEAGTYKGEVFDTITHQILWRGQALCTEYLALLDAEIVLTHLEEINGFGSISLYEESSGDFSRFVGQREIL